MRVLRWFLGAILGLVVLVTLASFAFNAATSDANVPVTQLWHGKFVDADGVQTAYREWGTHGSPIVLLGGFLEPSFVWNNVGPLLAAAGHRVYALDLDGFGYTERRGPYTLTGWADQVQGFERALGLNDPVVVGHSLGAAVAVEEARLGVASRIVLVDGDALSSGAPPHLLVTAFAHSPFFTTAFRLGARWPWPARRILRSAYGPVHPVLDNALVSRWTNPLRAKGARRALQKIAENGLAGFTRAELRTLSVKAVIVWGANDSVDSPSAGRTTAKDLHAQFVEIPHAGHLALLTAPRAVAVAIAP